MNDAGAVAWFGGVRRAFGVMALVGLAIILAGIVALALAPLDRPGDRVRLFSSTWTVTQIGDYLVAEPTTLVFDENTNSGHVESDCSELKFGWSTDTDGSAFVIWELTYRGSDCSSSAAERDTKFRAAMPQITAWRAPSASRIELIDDEGKIFIVASK